MTPEQYRLVNRSTAPWLTLWLLADFESGRSYAVGAMGGGTYHFGDERGQYATTGKGMSAWRHDRATPDVTVTWGEVKRWVESQPAHVHETAARLRREGVELQASYPSPYYGIGRPYSWDRTEGCTPEEREKDLADLDAANQRRERDVEAWQVKKAEYDERLKAFLVSLTPEAEPTLFDELAVNP